MVSRDNDIHAVFGHTHIDVDQMFSTFSMYLDKNSVEYITDIAEALKSAYRKDETKPKGWFLPVVFNFVGFLAPFVSDLSGLNSAHVFLIRKLSSGVVGMKVKKWHSTDDEWVGDTVAPDDWIVLMKSFPAGKPEEVPYGEIDDMLTLDSIKKYSTWLSDSSIQKWQTCLSSEEIVIPPEKLFPMHPNMWSYNQVYSFIMGIV